MSLGGTTNLRRVTLLLWVLVAVFYFYLSYDYIRVTTHDRQFAEYLQYVVQLAGNQGRSAKDVRELLIRKAEQLSLPLEGEQIVVRGAGDSLNVAVNYDVDIEFPLIQREFLTKKFEHKVKYQTPR